MVLLAAFGVFGTSFMHAAQPVARAASSCALGATLNVVAHEDDDLLFLSPDLLHDVRSGRCVRTVFVTAGDGGGGEARWMSRESGVRAAYAQMAGVADVWSTSDAAVRGHTVTLLTLDAYPRVSVMFLRLPDGWLDGSGTAADGYESLQKLLEGRAPSLRALDGSSTYTRSDLSATLTALMNLIRPDVIRTQDFVGRFGDGDHSDHHAVGYLTDEAQRAYDSPHVLIGYEGYGVESRVGDVVEPDLGSKRDAFLAYLAYDPAPCGSPPDCSSNGYGKFLARQYRVSGTQSAAGSIGGSPGHADLRVAIAADRAAVPAGGTILWRIRVDDVNGAAAVGAWAHVTLPEGVELVDARADRGPGCTGAAQGEVRCDLDWLSADAPVGNILVRTKMGLPGTVRLTVATGADGGDAQPGDNTATASVFVEPFAPAQPLVPPVARPQMALVPGSVSCMRDPEGIVRIGAVLNVNEPARMKVVIRDRHTGKVVSILGDSSLGESSTTDRAESLSTRIPRAASIRLVLRVSRPAGMRPCSLIVHVAAKGADRRSVVQFPLGLSRPASAKALDRR
jgi:LmbE family N-acetylglucosaminyl deacetylase